MLPERLSTSDRIRNKPKINRNKSDVVFSPSDKNYYDGRGDDDRNDNDHGNNDNNEFDYSLELLRLKVEHKMAKWLFESLSNSLFSFFYSSFSV